MSASNLEYVPLFQEQQFVGPVSYHKFAGTLVTEQEKESIVNDLGLNNVS